MKNITKKAILLFGIFLLGTSILSAQTGRDWWNSLTPAWKKVIQKQQFKGKNVTPTDEQLEQIINMTFLDVEGNKDIKTLKFAAALSLLEIIRAGGSGISNLEGIEDLVNLKELDCSDNDNVTSIREVADLYNLEKLNCGNTMVKSLRPIMNLKKISVLDAHLCTIIDLNSIRNFKNLIRLDVSENSSLFSLDGLEKVTSLTELDCSETRITSLAPLAKLPALELLDCSKAPVRTLKPIQLVKSLKDLNVSKTDITGASLDYLLGHSNLTMIRAKNIDIDEDEIVDFEKLMLKRNRDVTIIVSSK